MSPHTPSPTRRSPLAPHTRPRSFLQLYKLAEELGVALTAAVPFSVATFYLVRLQGSFALFLLVCVMTTACSTGGWAPCQGCATSGVSWPSMCWSA